MIADIQQDLVAHFGALREELAPKVGELVPAIVGAYAGQLLRPDQLIEVVPALWCDIQAGTVDLYSEGGGAVVREPSVEIVLATINQTGQDAGYSDGVALTSWALRALLARPITIAGVDLRPTGPARFRRIASDDTFWAGRITVDLSSDIELS